MGTGPFGGRILNEAEVDRGRPYEFVEKAAEAPADKPRSRVAQMMRGSSSSNRGRVLPRLSYELLYEIADKSYIARMVIWAIVRECTRRTDEDLRNFWTFYPRFRLKCTTCDAEYQEDVKECKCGATVLRGPDPAQLEGIVPLLDDPNDTYTFGDIVKRCFYDGQVVDDWFVSIGYDYTGDFPVRLWYEDPRYMRIMANEYGMLGNDEWFCPLHTRDNPEKHYPKSRETCPEAIVMDGRRQPCGQRLLQTAYTQEIDGRITARFSRGEIIHGTMYSTGTRLYGSSPLSALLTAVATHMAIDQYGYDAFTMQREPNSAIIFTGTAQSSVDAAAEKYRAERRENPHAQIWLGLKEGQALEYVKMLDSISNTQTIAEREYYQKVFCSVYGVSPIFVAIETPGRLGNTNDWQIHVQNNTTESQQGQFSEQINRDLLPLFGVTDWYWDFTPVRQEDQKLAAETLNITAQAAKTAVDAGFTVTWDDEGVHVGGEGSRPAAPAAPQFGPGAAAALSMGKMSGRAPDSPRGERALEEDFYYESARAYEDSINRVISGIGEGMTDAEVKALIDSEMNTLDVRLGRKARSFVEAVYRKGLEQAAKDAHVSIGFDAADADAVDYLMTRWAGVATTLPEFTQAQRDTFSAIVEGAYKDPGKFSLDDMTRQMREASDAERFKLERIARTETSIISNNGRVNGYLKVPGYADRKYSWSVAPDACDECRAIADMGPMNIEELRWLTNNGFGDFCVHPNDRCTPILEVEGMR